MLFFIAQIMHNTSKIRNSLSEACLLASTKLTHSHGDSQITRRMCPFLHEKLSRGSGPATLRMRLLVRRSTAGRV